MYISRWECISPYQSMGLSKVRWWHVQSFNVAFLCRPTSNNCNANDTNNSPLSVPTFECLRGTHSFNEELIVGYAIALGLQVWAIIELECDKLAHVHGRLISLFEKQLGRSGSGCNELEKFEIEAMAARITSLIKLGLVQRRNPTVR